MKDGWRMNYIDWIIIWKESIDYREEDEIIKNIRSLNNGDEKQQIFMKRALKISRMKIRIY